jgi:hypothetical protein
MRSDPVFSTIVVLQMVTSTFSFDSTLPPSDDPLFTPLDQTESLFGSAIHSADTIGFTHSAGIFDDPNSSSSDQSASLFDQVDLPMDAEYDPMDSIESLLWEEDSGIRSSSQNDDVTYSQPNSPFELADCSASEYLPMISKKNRVKRQDVPGFCRSPAAANEPSKEGYLGDPPYAPDVLKHDLENNRKAWERVKNLLESNEENPFCYLYTAGKLPYGVCSNKALEVEWIVSINNIQFDATMVSPCTIGMRCLNHTLFDADPTPIFQRHPTRPNVEMDSLTCFGTIHLSIYIAARRSE